VKPYFERDGVVLYHGDCREILPTIEGVDCVVTDPPYGTGGWKRPKSGAGSDGSAVMERFDWDVWDDSWMQLTDCETVGMFIPQTQLKKFVRLFFWQKTDPRPRFSGQPAFAFEPFIVARGRVRGIGGSDVISASAPRENRDADANGHPHQKPIKVMKWCVRLCSDEGEAILDPFAGSGTTLRAAMDLGRKAIGIEISEKYCEIAAKRLEQRNLQFAEAM
jgi:site-specific DNA-methyltransferase (adenine-specific)